MNAFKLPDAFTGTGEYIDGHQANLRSAEGFLYIPDLDLELIITIDGMKDTWEILIGRQVLEEVYLALKGPERLMVLTTSLEELKLQLNNSQTES